MMSSVAPAPPAPPPAPPTPDPGGGRGPGEARWVRPFVVVAAVLVLLLVGATGGLLIGRSGADTSTTPGVASVDVGFAQDMSVHHGQAVEMASWERDHTVDPELTQLASDIEATQTAQIGRMQGWLELWGAASLPTGGYMAWMADAGHSHSLTSDGAVAQMPGMASTQELRALRAATGPALDVLFLQLMLRHHEGGAGMLEYASVHAAVPEVRNLASQMLRSQASESEYLKQLLAARGGTPLPS